MEEETGRSIRPERYLSLKGKKTKNKNKKNKKPIAKHQKNSYNKHTRLTDKTKDGARKKELNSSFARGC